MESLYVLCATLAGGVLFVQLVFMLLGMGHDADLHDGGMDVHLDADADVDLDQSGVGHADHSGTWFVGILSLRAICSALLIFGLAGLSAEKVYDPDTSFLIATVAGVVVLFGVAYMLKTLYGFASDGSVKSINAVGMSGQVYLTIPGENQGKGKVTVSVQGRTMEFSAVTEGEALPTGTSVLVVDLPSDDVLAVVRDDSSPSLGNDHVG